MRIGRREARCRLHGCRDQLEGMARNDAIIVSPRSSRASPDSRPPVYVLTGRVDKKKYKKMAHRNRNCAASDEEPYSVNQARATGEL